MFRLTFLLGLGVFISLTDTLRAYTWRPVLEEPVDGCPCKVQLGGMATQMSRMASELIPRAEYIQWVANGRPDRLAKFPSLASPASFGNVSEPLVRKSFCFVADKDDDGDYNVVVYSADGDLEGVEVEDIGRRECPIRSIYDYNQWGDKNECDNEEGSNSVNASAKSLTPASRIIHGRVVQSAEIAAYNVKITRLDDHEHIDVERCTGSLVAPQYVLTAAHCKVKTGEHVYIGEYLGMRGEAHTVTKTIVHEGYIELKADHRNRLASELNDIQLLYLEAPVANAEKRMVTLNSDCNRPVPCRHALVSGYGKSAEHECKDDILRATVVNIVGHDECHKLLKDAHEGLVEHCLDESPHICATHDLCGSGLCKGDSGGPLVIADKDTRELIQIGISSFIVGDCGARDHPDIYTRVSEYSEWIYRNTDKTARFDPPFGPDRNKDCPVVYHSDNCRFDAQGNVFRSIGDDGKGGQQVEECPSCG